MTRTLTKPPSRRNGPSHTGEGRPRTTRQNTPFPDFNFQAFTVPNRGGGPGNEQALHQPPVELKENVLDEHELETGGRDLSPTGVHELKENVLSESDLQGDEGGPLKIEHREPSRPRGGSGYQLVSSNSKKGGGYNLVDYHEKNDGKKSTDYFTTDYHEKTDGKKNTDYLTTDYHEKGESGKGDSKKSTDYLTTDYHEKGESGKGDGKKSTDYLTTDYHEKGESGKGDSKKSTDYLTTDYHEKSESGKGDSKKSTDYLTTDYHEKGESGKGDSRKSTDYLTTDYHEKGESGKGDSKKSTDYLTTDYHEKGESGKGGSRKSTDYLTTDYHEKGESGKGDSKKSTDYLTTDYHEKGESGKGDSKKSTDYLTTDYHEKGESGKGDSKKSGKIDPVEQSGSSTSSPTTTGGMQGQKEAPKKPSLLTTSLNENYRGEETMSSKADESGELATKVLGMQVRGTHYAKSPSEFGTQIQDGRLMKGNERLTSSDVPLLPSQSGKDSPVKDGKPVPVKEGSRRIYNKDIDERLNFAMDGSGGLYTSDVKSEIERSVDKNKTVTRHNHSSLVGGGDVAAAGMLKTRDGKVEELSDGSGHYKPTLPHTEQAVEHFKKQGVMQEDRSTIRLTGKGYRQRDVLMSGTELSAYKEDIQGARDRFEQTKDINDLQGPEKKIRALHDKKSETIGNLEKMGNSMRQENMLKGIDTSSQNLTPKDVVAYEKKQKELQKQQDLRKEKEMLRKLAREKEKEQRELERKARLEKKKLAQQEKKESK